MKKRLGLIINPVAGIGGRVGLKGSDGSETLKKAKALGAVSESQKRAAQALNRLDHIKDDIQVVTYPYEMGEYVALACGFDPIVIGCIKKGETTPKDTENAAREMLEYSVDILLFAGGDGTARNIYNAIGVRMPVLGIPAGVKMHSAVYAINSLNAGDLAALYLQEKATDLREAEVMDIDEDAFREGRVTAKLYGYLKVPYEKNLVQGLKSGSAVREESALLDITSFVIDNMSPEHIYIIGPGTTTRAIMDMLGLKNTLLGVDVVNQRKLVANDVNETQLLNLIEGKDAKIVVTPIGGQGYLFGRGNQQISPKVIKKIGKENIIVIAVAEKIYSLGGRPFLVDTGDAQTDKLLSGYYRVITGYNEEIVYKCR